MLQEGKSVNLLVKKSGLQTATAAAAAGSPNSVSADSALREQLHQEIENKSKSCSNPTYQCGIPRVDGFEYCIRHILRDPRGQYRQCTYVYGNGRKCQHAVLKHDNAKDQALTTFCFEHSRQAQLKKTRATVGKLRDIETNEVLLNNLAHHIQLDEPIKELTKSPGDELIDVVSPQISSFVNYKNVNGMQNVLRIVRKRPRILDFASDSSDEDVSATKITKLRKDFDESDDESMGSDDDDTLRRASIYTIQESLKLSIGKLDKVRTLYEMQAQHLNHFLKERRRKYLSDLRKEREVHCSIHDQARNTAKERLLYSKLKLLTRYHRRHGHEAVLYRKYKEKRTKSYDMQKAPSHPKCVFTEGGVKCGDRTIPCSKFCRKHILEDKKQTLFRACRVEKSNVICHEPTICIGEDTNCMLHLFIPPKQQYTQKKNDSETEDEESMLKAIITTTTAAASSSSVSTTTTTTTVAAAAAKILKNVDVNESLQKLKSSTITTTTTTTTANVEVVPIDANASSVASQSLKTENMKTKLQQQEEMIKKVLQNSSKSSLSRRQQKRHNNRRKAWTSRPKKRLQQQEIGQQQKSDDKVNEKNQKEEEEEKGEKGEEEDGEKVVATTTTTTTKLLTITTTTTTTNITDKQQQQQRGGGGGGSVVVRKKPLELLKHQHQHHQSPALLQQQQQIEKQLQKQQVQQSPPQIFQIQNQQQQQQQQQQLLPIKRIIPQLQQQQGQQKTLSLANVKQIINLHQLQQQQQQQQQIKLPTTTTTTGTTGIATTTTTAANIKQFINLPTQQQQQKHATSILMRLPTTTTIITTTTTTTTTVTSTPTTTISTTIKTNILLSSSQQPQSQLQQQQQQQKQVIQLPVQRTTRFQIQQNANAAAAAATTTTTNTSVAAAALNNVGGSGNITYHTIPGLPKSTSVIINKQFLPKPPIVGVQQQQQQEQEQASSQHDSAK